VDDIGTYLVTGALGCIGAWVTRLLLKDGARVIAFDAGKADHRLDAALIDVPVDRLARVSGDVSDPCQVNEALTTHAVDAIIHLAALQVPACASDPALGARVNVVGHLVMLEAARHTSGRPLVYASSVAAYDREPGGATSGPATFYGVYKRACEQAAALYWQDFGVASVGLRPHTVYGPGRDAGLTSEPTRAILAAIAGEPFHLSFGGRLDMQYVEDVAQSFVNASRSHVAGAELVDLAGHTVSMSEIVTAIDAVIPGAMGGLTFDDVHLPFPTGLGHEPAPFPRARDRSLEDGIRATLEHQQVVRLRSPEHTR